MDKVRRRAAVAIIVMTATLLSACGSDQLPVAIVPAVANFVTAVTCTYSEPTVIVTGTVSQVEGAPALESMSVSVLLAGERKVSLDGGTTPLVPFHTANGTQLSHFRAEDKVASKPVGCSITATPTAAHSVPLRSLS